MLFLGGRRSELAPYPGDKTYDQQSQCLLAPNQVQIFTTYFLQQENLLDDITTATAIDRFAQEIKACFEDPTHRSSRDDLENFSF